MVKSLFHSLPSVSNSYFSPLIPANSSFNLTSISIILISLSFFVLQTFHYLVTSVLLSLPPSYASIINFLLQVDALKAKLAAQEVELQKKNDEADKLIRIVEAETAKVSQHQ